MNCCFTTKPSHDESRGLSEVEHILSAHDWNSIKQQVVRYQNISKAKQNTDEIFTIDLSFVILYQNNVQKLPKEYALENLKVVNNVFNGHSKKSSNIHFTCTIPIQYIRVTNAFNASDVTERILQTYNIQKDKLNVFVGPFQSADDNVLGVSHAIPCNVLFINWKVLGGPSLCTNLIPHCNQGKTLVHEIGHSLSLQHPHELLFDFQEYSDIFDQQQVNGNHDPNVVHYAHNVMNYGKDDQCNEFTSLQIDQMRGYLMSGDHEFDLSVAKETNKTVVTSRNLDQEDKFVLLVIFATLFTIAVISTISLHMHTNKTKK